jgi:putative solute:sodium symporter small subunit
MSETHRSLPADLARRYWRSNVKIMAVLLALWALAGLGCGVLWADWLNQWSLGGVPLGFWFAQQGSIIVFVLIILVYAILANGLDRKYHRLMESRATQGGVR